MPINYITRKEYSGQNSLALSGHKEWGTFLQWKGAGFQVKRGQHGTKIVKIVDYTDPKGQTQHAPRFYTVFNREQVEPVMKMTNSYGKMVLVR